MGNKKNKSYIKRVSNFTKYNKLRKLGIVKPKSSDIRKPADIIDNSSQTASETLEESNTDIQGQTFSLEGRRIVDIAYFIASLIEIGNHFPAMGCTLANMVPMKEKRNGLISTIYFKCNMCNTILHICTESKESANLNTSIIAGAMCAGTGYAQLCQIIASANMPEISKHEYKKVHQNVCIGWESSAKESMAEMTEKEKNLSIEANDFTSTGIPYTSVICDGSWAKRSYRNKYNSLSGAACVIGVKTRKVISLGVRNKYCATCNAATRKNKEIPLHRCCKNWEGSSSAMETDIIVQAFKASVQSGLLYKNMIGDGDSSCYKKICDAKPYGEEIVEKIECRNHLLRNYCNKIRDMCKVGGTNLNTRKLLSKNLLRLRSSVTKAIQFRKNEMCPREEQINNLRSDILNSIKHVFGEHSECASYFCKKQSEENHYNKLQNFEQFNKLTSYVTILAKNAKSLLQDVDSNDAEVLNSIIAKFIGGKRINYALTGSYQARCYAAVLSYNTNEPLTRLLKYMCRGSVIGRYVIEYEKEKKKTLCNEKKLYENKNNKRKQNKHLSTHKHDSDYGEHSQQTDMNNDDFAAIAESFIKSLQLSEEEIEKLEQETKNQKDNSLWCSYRKKIISASHFASVCKLKATTSRANIVRQIIYPKTISSQSVLYGIRNETVAIDYLKNYLKVDIEKCGLYLNTDYFYLGATPDGVFYKNGDKYIVEVKCPYTARDMTPEEAVKEKLIKFWKNNGEINKNHNWFFQIQGQLRITGAKSCFLCVYTQKGAHVREVVFDPLFWEHKMNDQLQNFFYKALLPEIIDPR